MSLSINDINLNKEQVNLSSFLKDLSEDYALTLPKHIQFIKSISDVSEEVSVDQFYFSTAIVNILNNAVKFEGSVIKITYQIENFEHIISISDNGIGISKKNKTLIFGKFFRVSEKNTHNFKGLGLGLYYCKQIINAHKGTLDVKSRKNEGSTFFIKLPLSNGKKNLISR